MESSNDAGMERGSAPNLGWGLTIVANKQIPYPDPPQAPMVNFRGLGMRSDLQDRHPRWLLHW